MRWRAQPPHKPPRRQTLRPLPIRLEKFHFVTDYSLTRCAGPDIFDAPAAREAQHSPQVGDPNHGWRGGFSALRTGAAETELFRGEGLATNPPQHFAVLGSRSSMNSPGRPLGVPAGRVRLLVGIPPERPMNLQVIDGSTFNNEERLETLMS